MNTKKVMFEQSKLQRLLKTHGECFEFKRNRLDKFKQPIDEKEKETFIFLGVYHETQGYASLMSTEGALVRSKKQPMIMTTFAEAKEIQLGDVLKYNNKNYKVLNIRDILENGIYADISLEVVEDGGLI